MEECNMKKRSIKGKNLVKVVGVFTILIIGIVLCIWQSGVQYTKCIEFLEKNLSTFSPYHIIMWAWDLGGLTLVCLALKYADYVYSWTYYFKYSLAARVFGISPEKWAELED